MSSRSRRRSTLKRLERGYQTGHSLSANTSGSRPEIIPTSKAEDTPTGSAPSGTGTPVAPNNGLGLASSSALRRNSWRGLSAPWGEEYIDPMSYQLYRSYELGIQDYRNAMNRPGATIRVQHTQQEQRHSVRMINPISREVVGDSPLREFQEELSVTQEMQRRIEEWYRLATTMRPLRDLT